MAEEPAFASGAAFPPSDRGGTGVPAPAGAGLPSPPLNPADSLAHESPGVAEVRGDAADADRAADAEDPWAHRRGEPRLFAFFWTLYVLVAVGGSVFWLARTGGWMLGGYGPAGRIMLVVIAAGATLLWPMTRLSQASPGAGAIGAVLADIVVVMLPIQMVVWPMSWMAGWPIGTVVGIAAVFAAWIALAGGVLAVALGGEPLDLPRDPRLTGRTVWMGILVAMTMPGMALGLAFHGERPPEWLAMLSPYSGILALTGEGVSGPRAAMTGTQWLALGSVGVWALCWWVIATGRSMKAAALLSPPGRPA